MKKTIWKILCSFVVLIALASHFLLFKSNLHLPTLFDLPGVFWIGILFTAFLVLATFLGSLFFPFKEEEI